jgi:hypothetical protein
MTLVRPFREWSLGAKVATTFLVVVAGVATLVGVAVIRHERTALDAELRKRGINLAEHLSRLSQDLVLQDDLWGGNTQPETIPFNGIGILCNVVPKFEVKVG